MSGPRGGGTGSCGDDGGGGGGGGGGSGLGVALARRQWRPACSIRLDRRPAGGSLCTLTGLPGISTSFGTLSEAAVEVFRVGTETGAVWDRRSAVEEDQLSTTGKC